jgi:hypothetical protein
MHYSDLGLFHYQIEYTREILNNSYNDEINQRLVKIPRFPRIKIFSYGIQTIARLTADEYRNLMKVMIFVIDKDGSLKYLAYKISQINYVLF